jgi:hypothetical protein
MIKTKSFIQSIYVTGGRPKDSNGLLATLVRAPKTMKCFRATIIVNNYGGTIGTQLWISSFQTALENECVYLNANYTTATQIAPNNDFTYTAPNILILDRRGVGYMEDEFYLQGDEVYVTIVWEGISEQ